MAEGLYLVFDRPIEARTNDSTDKKNSPFVGIAKLGRGEKQKCALGVANVQNPCVLGHSNDLEILIIRPDPEANVLTDRILRSEEVRGQQAIDDGCTGMLLIIRPGEIAAAGEWNTKRSKESWRDDDLGRCDGVSRVRRGDSGDGVFPGKCVGEDRNICEGCGPNGGKAGDGL